MPLSSLNGRATDMLDSVRFFMRAGETDVECHVLRSVLDEIERPEPGTAAERVAVFERHRARFEAAASARWDAGQRPPRVTLSDLG